MNCEYCTAQGAHPAVTIDASGQRIQVLVCNKCHKDFVVTQTAEYVEYTSELMEVE